MRIEDEIWGLIISVTIGNVIMLAYALAPVKWHRRLLSDRDFKIVWACVIMAIFLLLHVH
jgi:TctA family transporter